MKCPSCTREIRVTEEELVDKRAFCAVCDARFDLVPGIFIGDGPNRSLEVVAAKLPDLPPTGKMRLERAADGTETTITVDSARPFPGFALLFCVVWFGFLAFWYSNALRRGNVTSLLFPLIHVTAGTLLLRQAVKDIRGRDRLTFGADALEIERRGACWTRVERVPYREIVGARAEPQPVATFRFSRGLDGVVGPPPGHRVLLVRSGADPIPVGNALGHGLEAAAWLAAKIDEQSRRARSLTPPASLLLQS